MSIYESSKLRDFKLLKINELSNELEPITDVGGRHDENSRFVDRSIVGEIDFA